MADKIKLLLALALVLAGVAGFYYFSEDASTWVRVLALLGVAVVALIIALQTEAGRDTWGYLVEARNEIRRVVWPTREETTKTTLIIMVAVIIVAIILWGLDTLLLWAVRLLTSQGG
jgi:preprotein translocase subunit SecE